MAKAKKTSNGTAASIMVVLDRSGSMSSVRDATIAGFNQFIKDQQALPGAKFSMLQFDTVGIDDLYIDKPVQDVVPLSHATYQPRAGTPLYDAIGKGIKALEARQPTGKVIFCMVTDGEENSSHEFSREAIFDMVKAKRAEGWEFVFMGANIDAYAVGGALGVAKGSTYGYAGTAIGTQAAFHNLSSSTLDFRGGLSASVSMPDVDTADPSYVPGQAAGASPWTSGPAPVRTSRTKVTPLPTETLGSTK